MKKNKRLLLGLTTILALGMFMGNVRAENIGDISSGIDGSTGSGCSGKDSCWLYADGGIGHPVYGIRVSIVDGNGNLVSKKAMDYLATEAWVYKVNNNKSYYRYTGSNGEIVNRMTLLLNPSSASLRKHNGSAIAKIWPNELGALPYIYDDNINISAYIKTKLTNLEEEQLISLFFSDLGYTVPNNNILENHYMIIEPLTMVSAFNKATIYYGTYYELTKELINKYNYQNSDSNGKSWIASVLDMELPLSMYITGNEDISGYNSSAGTYFDGKLKITKDKYTWYQKSKNRTRVTTTYVKDGSIGYGIGIIAMNNLKIEGPTCDYGNVSHFASATSGPGGIDCCEYVLDNLGDYGILKSELFSKYSRCGSSANVNKCTINPELKNPECGKINSISDTENWSCIYDSVYSNDKTWQNYFLKHEEASCSVFCREKITFNSPLEISVLAGHRFNIGTKAQSYRTYVENNITKVEPATLGPIQSVVTKECRIIGTANSNCENIARTQVENLNAPSIDFDYDSEKYDNPSFHLSSTINSKKSGVTKENNTKAKAVIYKNSLTTNYLLPDDSTVFRYVTTNGISYKNKSDIGNQSYTDIGAHLPIHFGEKKGPNNYTINVISFNSNNFDTYINKTDKIKTSFEVTIETYVNKLIEQLNSKNDLVKQVNGIYYFSDTFMNRLKEKYSVDNFLSMTYTDKDSTKINCANTDNYVCGENANGIYCLNKNTNTNSEETYNNLVRNCVNNVTEKISANYKYDNSLYLYQNELTCQFNVTNLITPPPGDPGDPDINIIFRQISLNNPFPGKDGAGREVGANWGYGEDYTPNNYTINSVITNNRGVETDKIYRELDPLYKITLTPTLIKQIRRYNKDNEYDDFKLQCNSDGNNCTSIFIRGAFTSHFSGCGITNKSVGLTCNNDEKWNTLNSNAGQY